MAEPNPSNPPPIHTPEPFVIQINPPSPSPPTILPPSPSVSTDQPNQSHYMISMNNNELPFSTNLESPAPNTSITAAAPNQFHGSVRTLVEQFLSHIVRQHQPQQLNPSASFSIKVEPIQLHLNSSSVPLINHTDQPISSKTISESNPPKQEQIEPAGGGGVAPPALNGFGKHQKALTKAGSLANLLPTGTVLAFQALIPSLSFEEGGKCHLTNKVVVGGVMAACSIVCFFSSLTDSVSCGEKVYYGLASPKGLLLFDYDKRAHEEPSVEKAAKDGKLQPKDLVHAFLSVAVFLVFAFSSSEVQRCFFPTPSDEAEYSMVVYLPLLAGIVSSFFFTILPTKRKGIGYA